MNHFFGICAGVGVSLLLWAGSSHLTSTVEAATELQAGGQVGAQQVSPAVAAGRQTFTTNCSFCHGPDARGGAEGGPDLTRSAIVTGDLSGAQFTAFLQVGKPPKMPSFNLPSSDVAQIMEFLKVQIAANSAGRGGGNPKAILVGDAAAGQAYFNGPGKCTTCHSVTGDLKGIGSKYDAMALQGRMVLPRARGGYPGLGARGAPDAPRTVTVSAAAGPALSGELISVSDYFVTVRDSSGSTHTIARNGDSPKVVIKDPVQAHVDMLPKLGNKNMHDLTAYLVTVK